MSLKQIFWAVVASLIFGLAALFVLTGCAGEPGIQLRAHFVPKNFRQLPYIVVDGNFKKNLERGEKVTVVLKYHGGGDINHAYIFPGHETVALLPQDQQRPASVMFTRKPVMEIITGLKTTPLALPANYPFTIYQKIQVGELGSAGDPRIGQFLAKEGLVVNLFRKESFK